MDDDDVLAGRSRLEAVAYRMLGTPDEAGEAVEEALREAARRPTAGERPLDTLARICLARLRARETHRTARWDPWDPWDTPAVRPGPGAGPAGPPDPALLTALDTLTPPERIAFVLHDLFDVPHEEVAPVLDRTPAAARQLAARARHRVRGTEEMPEPDPARQRETVAAFLAASRGGDSEALLALLDPDVALRADPTAVRAGMRTAHGAAGLVLTRDGRPDTVFAFTVLDGRITSVDVLADEGHLSRLTVRPLTENTAGP